MIVAHGRVAMYRSVDKVKLCGLPETNGTKPALEDFMNHIASEITIGAPHSKARYENANRICADCLQSEPPPATHYKALVCCGIPLTMTGQCYVCEKTGIPVVAVEASL